MTSSAPSADTFRVLFIHHSVGRGVLTHGRVRERLARLGAAPTVALSDHDYNRRGLSGPDGVKTSRTLPIPDDNTDPPGLKNLFQVALGEPRLGAELKSYDLVIVKSCFPNSRIGSDESLLQLQNTYRSLIDLAEELGVTLAAATTPPVRAGRIEPDAARRAASLAAWMTAQDGFAGCFDLFGLLADTVESSPTYGMLRRQYTNALLIDSHPTRDASSAIGQPFAEFIHSTARRLAATT